MQGINTIEGDLIGRDLRVGIVAARFNGLVVESLVSGAVDALVRHGVERGAIELVRVPGAWELPVVAQRMARDGGYDAIVALGVVIRGATPHFDFVAGECSKGLGAVSMNEGIAVGFGVLTVDTIEQALERAGTKAGNKGADAALSAIETANVLRRLER